MKLQAELNYGKYEIELRHADGKVFAQIDGRLAGHDETKRRAAQGTREEHPVATPVGEDDAQVADRHRHRAERLVAPFTHDAERRVAVRREADLNPRPQPSHQPIRDPHAVRREEVRDDGTGCRPVSV